MAEYIEREALFAKCKKTVDNNWNKETTPFSWAFAYGQFVEALLEAPAADVVEVVRCGECKHYGWEQEPNHGRSERFCKLHKGLALVNRDTFCSYGERKDGASDDR